MTLLALLLVGAALAYSLASRLRLPAPPLLICSGVLLQLLGLSNDAEALKTVLMLGVTVLVFVSGAELDPSRFTHQLRLALTVAVMHFVLLGSSAAAVSFLFGYAPLEVAYLAVSVAGSSTFVVVRSLKQKGHFYEPFGRLLLGILLVQDGLVILSLPLLNHWQAGQLMVESGMLRSCALLGVAWFCAQTVVPWILTRLRLDEETQLIAVLAMLFTFLAASFRMEIPLLVGAFAAGFAVSSFPSNAVVRGQLVSFSDFFVALFFTALGALVKVPAWKELALVAVLMLLILVVTPVLVTWLAERFGMTARTGLQAGLYLAQTSEFSLVVAFMGNEGGHVSDQSMGALTLLAVLTMALVQFLARESVVWKLLRFHPQRLTFSTECRQHTPEVILLGCGRSAESLLVKLLQRGERVLVVDHDPSVCAWIRSLRAQAVLGDASDVDLLRRVQVARANLVVSNLCQVSDNCRIVRAFPGLKMVVRTFEQSEADLIEAAGGIPVLYSAAAAEDFFRWYDHDRRTPPPPFHPDASTGESSALWSTLASRK